VLDASRDKKVSVHCAANYRVSIFGRPSTAMPAWVWSPDAGGRPHQPVWPSTTAWDEVFVEVSGGPSPSYE